MESGGEWGAVTRVDRFYAALPKPVREVLRLAELWRAHERNSRGTCADAVLEDLSVAQDELEEWQAKLDAEDEGKGVRATRALKRPPVRQRPKLRIVRKDEGEG